MPNKARLSYYVRVSICLSVCVWLCVSECVSRFMFQRLCLGVCIYFKKESKTDNRLIIYAQEIKSKFYIYEGELKSS